MGLDDFVVAQGLAALQEIIAAAGAPAEPDGDMLKVAAKTLDPHNTVPPSSNWHS